MSAFELPAADAPTAEWGRLAVSIPGWRGPDLPPDCDLPALWDAANARPVPDPDHWAWEGWLLRLIGNPEKADKLADELCLRRDECAADAVIDAVMSGVPGRISRACIAAAAAIGRWPGGGE